MTMGNVGDIERITQNRVVKLFKEKLGYTYLGNWEESLIKQMKKGSLPDFNEVWRKANRKFRKLIELLEN